MALNITQASDLLSEYLSAIFRVPIGVPVVELSAYKTTLSIGEFIALIPTVAQKTADGHEITFQLPLVAQGKSTTLTPSVSNVVNELLYEAREKPDVVFEVPTFFYPDGSAMVIRFDPRDLFNAAYALTKNQTLVNFVSNALGGLKGAHHAS